MGKEEFDGAELEAMLQEMPGGRPQLDVLPDIIRQADEADDYYWRLMFRSRYCYEATFRDDPAKAIPMAAEYCDIFEEYADEMLDEFEAGAAEMHLMIMQMGIDPMVCLPQIPMEQWERAMDQFYHYVQEYQVGLRTYWWQMTQFWQYVDRDKAYSYFQKFWETEPDDLSDCPACECSHAVHMALMMGDRAAADAYAKLMEEGEVEFCENTPQLYWLAYLEDDLNRGDLKEAEIRANALYHKGNRDRSDLSYVGAVLRCWAYTDLDRAVDLVEQRLEWTIGMWDQKKCYDFYKGAWSCFAMLAQQQTAVYLNLPRSFPLWRQDSVYDAKELANWFHTQAEEIGRRFDRRNGNDYFVQDLALTLAPSRPEG